MSRRATREIPGRAVRRLGASTDLSGGPAPPCRRLTTSAVVYQGRGCIGVKTVAELAAPALPLVPCMLAGPGRDSRDAIPDRVWLT